MRIEFKSVVAGLAVFTSVLAMQSPAAAEAVTIPPMSQDPVTESMAPAAQDQALGLDLKGKKMAIPLPPLYIPLPAGGLDLAFRATPAAIPAPKFGGYAIGMYADGHLADIKLNSGRIAASYIDPSGQTVRSASFLSGETPWPLFLWFSSFSAYASGGGNYNKTRFAEGKTEVTNLGGPTLHAEARAERRLDGSCVVTTDVDYINLKDLGVNYEEKEVAPNTTYDVPGLGKVILNEQNHVNIPGQKCGARLNPVHIKLSEAQQGLPAGVDIYIGAIEAIVYG